VEPGESLVYHRKGRVTDVSRTPANTSNGRRETTSRAPSPLGFERDTTDHPFLPTRGSLNTILTEITSKYLGSDSEYVRTEIQSGWYHPLFGNLSDMPGAIRIYLCHGRKGFGPHF